ncbi:aquaporin-9 [Elysia marginata]|uniref:Aquaporin-9 n=1 Tax=Elysia marginata TaxID=1093978 RepID=A0AAV4JXE9_9GAST|nr:aquaporin-9 [Elysia marginata]
MLAFYMCGGVSGGCFNPAVSLALCLTGRRPWSMYPWHVVGQMVGAFIAATLAFSVYSGRYEQHFGIQYYVAALI